MTPLDLPVDFLSRMRESMGSEADALFSALGEPPSISVTLNPAKSAGHPTLGGAIPWSDQGRYLNERPSFVMDPHYHAGAYYSQEASSMVLRQVVRQLPLGDRPFCLDLCGAPGGKSIGLLESLPERAFLIANEVIRTRSKILIENLCKWGRHNYLPASAHPSQWSKHHEFFDLVLVDAPCSGEGMFRKEPKALPEWSMATVDFCAARQSSILSDMLPTIKPGGFLIYSTCTYAPQENEARMQELLLASMRPLKMSIDPSWGFQEIGDSSHGYAAYPHRVRGEGFFFCVFQKEQSNVVELKPEIHIEEEQNTPIPMQIPAGFRLEDDGEEARLYSSEFEEEVGRLNDARLLLQNSLLMGEYKGRNFIPSHALAMCGLLSDPVRIDLSEKDAIRYLRKETFPLSEKDDGWYLAHFEGSDLGWIKIAAGRMKNHYPKEWMIRKRW